MTERLKVESAELPLSTQSSPPAPIDDSAGASGDGGAKAKAQEVAGKAKEQAQEVAGQAKEQAAHVAGQAKTQAQQVAGQAKEHAQQAVGQAKEKATAQVDQRSTQIGQQIGTQAQSLDGVAEELRRQGKDGPAKIAEQAGERIRSMGSYLEQTDGDSLVGTVRDAALDKPALAAAAGAAVGFAAGRLIKASGDADADDEPGQAADGGA